MDRSNEDSNRMMREMHPEARGGLEKKLAPASWETAGPGASKPAPESVERTIERILREK